MKNFTHPKNYAIFILAVFLFVSCSTEEIIRPEAPEYISIPDQHFETVLIDQGIDSEGLLDQKILRTDAEKISHLDLNPSGSFGEIRDLTGIEGFINLRYLSAYWHQLESIDLRANAQLDTVSLPGNYLSSIDISHNTNLIFLDLQSNELRTVQGLEKATSLKALNVSFNFLEEFTVNNASLEVLFLSNNELTSLNTQGATTLKNVVATSNKLHTVDFSTNTSLETLLLSDNQLQQIDLQANNLLTYLYISSNLLTNLDISKNQELVDLRVDRNPSLVCIQIQDTQEIPTVSTSAYQQLNSHCE